MAGIKLRDDKGVEYVIKPARIGFWAVQVKGRWLILYGVRAQDGKVYRMSDAWLRRVIGCKLVYLEHGHMEMWSAKISESGKQAADAYFAQVKKESGVIPRQQLSF